MLICNEFNETIMIDSIINPLESNYFWTLNLELFDFTLSPITMLTEIICSSILVEINDYKFILPANWNILVYDNDTMQLDVVEIYSLSSANFTTFIYGYDYSFVKPGNIRTLDYKYSFSNMMPSLNKHQMMCHMINPDSWIIISPSDGYGKYLKGKFVGDII